MRQETEVHFQFGTVILGFLSIFKKSQASSPFEALHSVCLSRCQRDAIPPVQMRRRPTAFSRVSTGDSDIPSSCEMKQEPEIKAMQGNRASSLSDREVSWYFSSLGGNLGYILQLRHGKPLKTFIFLAMSGSLSS